MARISRKTKTTRLSESQDNHHRC
uniref:Uncharacterized protein n=1 Tax=Arundo donax TaxID=35708 RepID=A0A0A9CAQ7_ARUDO